MQWFLTIFISSSGGQLSLTKVSYMEDQEHQEMLKYLKIIENWELAGMYAVPFVQYTVC